MMLILLWIAFEYWREGGGREGTKGRAIERMFTYCRKGVEGGKNRQTMLENIINIDQHEFPDRSRYLLKL